ncbi:MAG: DNA-formamidopyrimidine glycosylase family protein [Candidatus Hodarchaeales archaeon]|jgi:formamidopyrimidine-DNA glycosylase
MSIELPEAIILAGQMNTELVGKQVSSFQLQDYERLQKIGFLNKNISEFDQLINREITSVISRGNVILVKLANSINLILSPEYGGRILYHGDEKSLPKKFHLKLSFSDNTLLSVRNTNMGMIYVATDDNLEKVYVYKRDFSDKLSPTEDEFTYKRFSALISVLNRNLKSVMVGKDAVLVGLSNSAFQDIIYRAKLHPKRKASSLDNSEKLALFDAIKTLVQERIKLGGKDLFQDLYGNKGGYVPTMGPNMKKQDCSDCGTTIEKMSFGGGQVYYCTQCQTI